MRSVQPGGQEQGPLAQQGATVFPLLFVLLKELVLMQTPWYNSEVWNHLSLENLI